jgi:hypothetical protein
MMKIGDTRNKWQKRSKFTIFSSFFISFSLKYRRTPLIWWVHYIGMKTASDACRQVEQNRTELSGPGTELLGLQVARAWLSCFFSLVSASLLPALILPFLDKFQKMGVFWNPHDLPDAAPVEFFRCACRKMVKIGDTSWKSKKMSKFLACSPFLISFIVNYLDNPSIWRVHHRGMKTAADMCRHMEKNGMELSGPGTELVTVQVVLAQLSFSLVACLWT